MADAILQILLNTVYFFLVAEETAIIMRCILSFLMIDEDDTVFWRLLVALTDPFVAPVRAVMEKIPAIAGSMFDFSYAVTVFILVFLMWIIEFLF